MPRPGAALGFKVGAIKRTSRRNADAAAAAAATVDVSGALLGLAGCCCCCCCCCCCLARRKRPSKWNGPGFVFGTVSTKRTDGGGEAVQVPETLNLNQEPSNRAANETPGRERWPGQ